MLLWLCYLTGLAILFLNPACRPRCTWRGRTAAAARVAAARAAAMRPRGALRAPPSRWGMRRALRLGCAPSGARHPQPTP